MQIMSFYKTSRCRYRRLTEGDEANFVRANYNVGSISISMNAIHDEFIFCRSGILHIPSYSSYNLYHAA
ncbi:hypothetical protein MXB_2954 [Myxobolus squamalis]|nr:hypothetical protein MXB_2954 [Myxobolus squamalis]